MYDVTYLHDIIDVSRGNNVYVLEAGLELGDIVRKTVDNNAFRKLVQGVL